MSTAIQIEKTGRAVVIQRKRSCLLVTRIMPNIFYHILLTGRTIISFSFFSCDLLQIDLYYDRQTKSQEARAMEFAKMRNLLLQLQETDYRNFIKALVSIETNCNDEEILDKTSSIQI